MAAYFNNPDKIRDAKRYDGSTSRTVEFEEWCYCRLLVREGYGRFEGNVFRCTPKEAQKAQV